MLLKELQSLALDVRVLRDDNTEVEIMESVDYGETDHPPHHRGRQESTAMTKSPSGLTDYTEQEFVGGRTGQM